MLRGVLSAVLMLAATAAAAADGIEQLKAFHTATKSGKVSFQQVVAGKTQQTTRESTGTFSFQRPGSFAGCI